MSSSEESKAIASLEAHYDILEDLCQLQATAAWVSENYLDRQAMPIPKHLGRDIHIRGELLNSLLILYRKCLDTSQRGGLDQTSVRSVLAELADLHKHLIQRANHVVAHPVHAASSTTIKIGADGSVFPHIFRPGYNKSDFDCMVALAHRLIPFVENEVARLTQQLRQLRIVPNPEPHHVNVYPWGSKVTIHGARERKDEHPEATERYDSS